MSESSEDTAMGNASSSQLFSSKGKPKVFSWGDAALTANITSEKVILFIHINIFLFLTMYIHPLYFSRQYNFKLDVQSLLDWTDLP